jgi:beta-phosphoglucomutase-like phosphatase (HAD superfamily)
MRREVIDIMSQLVSVRCKAVLFDMDGTLVDSTQVVELAWGGWAVRHNIPLEDVLSFSHGRPKIATLELSYPDETIRRNWRSFRVSKRHRRKEY